jgi:hypothetical protein
MSLSPDYDGFLKIRLFMGISYGPKATVVFSNKRPILAVKRVKHKHPESYSRLLISGMLLHIFTPLLI